MEELDFEPDVQAPEVVHEVALARSLPADFDLPTLLRFLPDPRLKAEADAAAAEALAIDVTGPGGLAQADAALVTLRARVKDIEEPFADPVSLAYSLHKRLTGLRADFLAAAKGALQVVAQRVLSETRRLERAAAAERATAQAEANRQAREQAARAAEAAAKDGATQAVVEQLKEMAATATAPPVTQATPAPRPAHSSVAKNWKARLEGTVDGEAPNPKTADLTEAQRASLKRLLHAVVVGQAPLGFVEVNWSAVNARAKSDMSTLDIPGLEAYDAGSLRVKAGRR